MSESEIKPLTHTAQKKGENLSDCRFDNKFLLTPKHRQQKKK